MPSTRRRFLGTLGAGALAGLAGCSLSPSEEPPAGSLRFENRHDVPHSITMRVTGVGTQPGDPGSPEGDVAVRPSQRNLTSSTAVEPDTQRTYDDVFTEPVWYGIEFTVDDHTPEHGGRVSYNPAPENSTGRYLTAVVYASGEFSWQISSTETAGRFTLDDEN